MKRIGPITFYPCTDGAGHKAGTLIIVSLGRAVLELRFHYRKSIETRGRG